MTALRALLIEDSLTQATQIGRVLEQAGLAVDMAADGSTGLQKAADTRPHLIILDVNLPDMDGYQICRRLRRDPNTAKIPVIMLTERSSTQALQAGIEAGADDYIPKDIFAAEHLLNSMADLGILE